MTSHGMAAAILHAYNHHQHLRLSPDDIWLTIAQGVSHHINYNAEKFRHYFVNHEGQEEIIIDADDILFFNNSNLEGDWPEAVNRLVVKTDEAVEKIDIKSLLECNFSTTTINSLTASRIVLLDMVKAYFTYKVIFMCGIPKVTLEGTLEDWEKVQEKVIQLRQLNLELDFWLDRLEPVICKFIETYKGEIDEEFWSKIVSQQSFGSGPSNDISGWVAVPFTTDTGLHLKFIAGFLGAQQELLENSNEVVVSPMIGWSVIDNKAAKEKGVCYCC
ncbi:8731_t:CDS:2 [Funneliformis caledonium]|uniref:8731_t:CDS:1 n=1 Tax=Funneliformis caledonium TaxID=1117310 RepID=A0A9N9FKT1_9GLOM|nr:8731_t:CDS:2 [Funneliformis caledonium]